MRRLFSRSPTPSDDSIPSATGPMADVPPAAAPTSSHHSHRSASRSGSRASRHSQESAARTGSRQSGSSQDAVQPLYYEGETTSSRSQSSHRSPQESLSYHPSRDQDQGSDEASDQVSEQASVHGSDPSSDSFGSGGALSDATQRADDYTEAYFSMPTRRQFKNFDNLRQRTIKNTRIVDFSALQTLGLEAEFLRITTRIGITPAFWLIAQKGYRKLTIEFLSSLELKFTRQDNPYIKFRMRQETHRVMLSDMREWFGFEPDPTTDTLSFSEGLGRESFWELISGSRAGSAFNKDFKQLNVSHPVLRCLLRIFGGTIFARGETFARANVEDMQLVDHMLRPDSTLERPDVMLAMIHHWLHIQQQPKVGGIISISAYVTLIADHLHLPIIGDEECKGPRHLSLSQFGNYKFIEASTARDGRGAWAWRMPDMQTSYVMPFPVTLSFDDRSTWFFLRPARVQPAPVDAPPPPPPPPPPQGDTEMTDATTSPFQMHPPSPPQMHPFSGQDPSFSEQVHVSPFGAGTSSYGAGPSTYQTGPSTSAYAAGPSTSYGPPVYPPPVTDPTIRDVYQLMYDMRQEQGAAFYDLQQRVAGIEDELRDWRWYDHSDD